MGDQGSSREPEGEVHKLGRKYGMGNAWHQWLHVGRGELFSVGVMNPRVHTSSILYPHLHSDGGLRSEHHLDARDVALGSIADKDLIGRTHTRVEGLGECLTQRTLALLRTVPERGAGEKCGRSVGCVRERRAASRQPSALFCEASAQSPEDKGGHRRGHSGGRGQGQRGGEKAGVCCSRSHPAAHARVRV